MKQGNFRRIIQPVPRAVDEFCTEFNEGLRLASRTIKPVPHRLISRIGDSLNPGYTPGRALSIAQQAGAPLSHVEEPLHRALAVVRSWYPANLSVSVQDASVVEQMADGPFDVWQASVRPNMSEFDLRRGIALAVEQRQATDHAIAAMQNELAKLYAERHQSRRRLRTSA